MSEFTLGVVSNVWAALLPGSPLEEQCGRARAAGFSYVELRQRALGSYEEAAAGDDRPWPIPEALARLRERAPGLGLNLAVEAPYMTREVSANDPYLQRCADAALALGGEPPVLRLVDASPAPALLPEETLDTLGTTVAGLAKGMWRLGVRLALENSKQPVETLRALIRRAASALPESVPAPQVCWDPHNQIVQQFWAEDPIETARTIGLNELFEFHFKQGRGTELMRDVRDGDLDWRAILTALHERGYAGPALYEIPPGEDAWERLERSNGYIRGLLGEIGAE